MKWKSLLVICCIFLFLFQGCVGSLHPLYTDDVLTWSDQILGDWKPIEQEAGATTKAENWEFKANGNKSYELIHYDEKGRPGTLEAHLVKLGAHYFFDLAARDANSEEIERFPELEKACMTDMEFMHYCPVHTFAKITFNDNELKIAMLDAEFIMDLIEQNRIRIRLEKVEDSYVLTESPKELQKFMIKYADDPNAFMDPIVLRK